MINDLANQALDYALKKVDHAEIFVEMDESVDASIQKDRVDFAKETFSLGIGIRVIKDNKMGFAYTTQLDNLDLIVENAVSNAKANQQDENFALATKSEYPVIKGTYDKKIESLELEDTIKFGRAMIDTALDKGCQPTSGGTSASYSRVLILNSEGAFCEDISTLFAGFIAVNAQDGEGVSTASESDTKREMKMDPEKIAADACRIAMDSRWGKSVETKDMDVLLDYHAVAGLMHTFSQAINGDNVQRGRSLYADQLGNQVTSSSLNIYDDATIPGGLNSFRSDGEGTPGQKTVIVEEGVLSNFIYDIHTAKKGNTMSTGNGVRSSYADMPTVGLSNFIMDFKDFKDISEVKNGIMVTDVLGAHTANPISGDFSVEAMNAFKIENGELVYPVRKAMLSGNIFAALKEAKAASSKTRQLGPFVVPPIIVPGMRVVG